MDVVVKPRKVTISHKVDAQYGTGPLTTTKAVTVSDDNLAINGNEDKESPSFDSSGNNYTPINHLLALSKHSQNYNPTDKPTPFPTLTWLKRLLRGRRGRLPVVAAAGTSASRRPANIGMILNGRLDVVVLQNHGLVDGRPVRHDSRRRWHGPDLDGGQRGGDRQGLLRVPSGGGRSIVALPADGERPALVVAAAASAAHLEHHLHVVRRAPTADPPVQVILGRSGCAGGGGHGQRDKTGISIV